MSIALKGRLRDVISQNQNSEKDKRKKDSARRNARNDE
jgi:hypothetical protein